VLRILCAALLGTGLELGACADLDFVAVSVPLSRQVAVGDRYMGIRLLGALSLSRQPVNGFSPRGLSGLSWDEDSGLLYALSDEAKLFHLRPVFSADLLVNIEIVSAYALLDARGRALKQPWTDSEGLAIDKGANGKPGDSELIISFERRPRISRYTPTGKWLRDEPLPASLQNPNYYSESNKALEAVTLHDRWGLLTAPERSPRGTSAGYVPIIASDRAWSYPLYGAPNSSLVAMEALPDGSLLTLERAFVSLFHPLLITLRHTHLAPQSTESLVVEEVAVFDTSQGWIMDNFEGLTRHRGLRFFMISDDNRSSLQSTLLVYFELLP
jgi:hypothetical protein